MSDEGEKTCPLCAEEMDLTDQQLKPCKCGYEICVWCWHHIMDMAEKDNAEGRCPACRIPYDKEKIVGMAASCERLVAEISTEKRKSQKTKMKSSEGKKQLNSMRVIQKNLVYIVGLPLNLADEDLLQHKEYFGQYGKVLKVSMSRTTAGVIQQFPNNTCSVYITYSKEEEAIRCIQSVHGFLLDGRSLKACFGTTKYCHAWLRNVPCTNPECLYLHEVGSHEDSFTKDEIISAYTRSRVQQISGATNNMLRRSGSMLPPPVDDYCSDYSASAATPIVKSTSNHNPTGTDRGSPPNGSVVRPIALPAAASWGMLASNQSQVSSAPCLNGPTKAKPDTVSGTSTFSSAVSSTPQTSILQSDTGKGVAWIEEGQDMNSKVKPDSLKTFKQQVDVNIRANVPEKPENEAVATTTSSEKPSPLTSNFNDWGTNVVKSSTNSASQTGESHVLEKKGIIATDGDIQNSCSDASRVDGNIRSEPSVFRTSSSFPDHSRVKSSGNQVFQQPHPEHPREPLSSTAEKKASFTDTIPAPTEHNWRTDSQTRAVPNTVSELEEDIISFDNQRLKDPEVVSRTTYLPNSANSLHVSNHSRSHSFQHNEAYGAMKGDPMFVDSRFGERSLLHPSSNSSISNVYPEKLNRSSSSSDRNMGSSFLLPNESDGMHMGRLKDNGRSNSTLDVGESSIISNILSLELDSWDDSLTSPQNLAKLLGETDKQPSSLSNSWKAHNSNNNNNQSRFSFARHEESRNQVQNMEPSYNVHGQLMKNRSFSQDFAENRNSYFDRLGIGNGFCPSNYEESGTFNGNKNPSILSSSRSSGSRAQVSAPPGFAMPNRAPPPGFSSHERMDQPFESVSGNHFTDSSSLLRNSFHAPAASYGSSGDIEFMDPAILAVGKGRLQGGLNSPVLDMRMNNPQQISAYENNEARLQLLMQRSLTQHPNLRYPDVGGSFSCLGDSYGISSRLDQTHVNNMSPVGKGRLQGGLNSPVLDMRMNNPQQISAYENNEARLQLLMQRSLTQHPNLRYPDVGGSFSCLGDSYGISSRLDQTHVNNMSPYGQLPLQNSTNGLMSSGHWDSWREVQGGGNSAGMTELLRNDSLGFNKFYSSGYEDPKYRMPSSGDLYNRTFEM